MSIKTTLGLRTGIFFSASSGVAKLPMSRQFSDIWIICSRAERISLLSSTIHTAIDIVQSSYTIVPEKYHKVVIPYSSGIHKVCISHGSSLPEKGNEYLIALPCSQLPLFRQPGHRL